MNDFNEIKDTLVSLDEQRLLQLVKDALENGIPAGDILNKGLIAGMDIVGEKMENEDIAPEEFVRMIKGKNANILCLSALLTTTMPIMKQTNDAVV
jgi:5-methyltetrahydrofolate--homocysteine methyltransferase